MPSWHGQGKLYLLLHLMAVITERVNIHVCMFTFLQGHIQVGGCQAGAPPPPNRNLKNTDFVDMTSKVLRDLPFRRNQPLKSADDSTLEF
jgi:hypothetical protein